jgi:hypothetical protein
MIFFKMFFFLQAQYNISNVFLATQDARILLAAKVSMCLVQLTTTAVSMCLVQLTTTAVSMCLAQLTATAVSM